MTCEHVRESLIEFVGEPGEALPADLRAHLKTCAGCSRDLEEMRDTWTLLGGLAEERPGGRMRERFRTMLAGASARELPKEALRRWTPEPAVARSVVQAAMLAAALVVGALLGAWIGSREDGRPEIEMLRSEMRSMTHAMTLSLLEHQSASERLRGIGLCEAAPPDDELIRALLRVINDDPSANVRIAALDVLASLKGRPDVRAGLIASLPRQASPPVTAALASRLLEIDGAGAVEAVRAAASDDRLPDSVRQYLLRILAAKAGAEGA